MAVGGRLASGNSLLQTVSNWAHHGGGLCSQKHEANEHAGATTTSNKSPSGSGEGFADGSIAASPQSHIPIFATWDPFEDNEADDEEWNAPNIFDRFPFQATETREDSPENRPEDTTQKRKHRCCETNPWWPFKCKDYLIASMLIGYIHTRISRSLYNHVKMLFSAYSIKLPDWNTIRREKKRLRQLLCMDVQGSTSILSKPIFGLSLPQILAQEVANPVVSPAIEYFPQEAHGKDLHKLSQSKKWLEELVPQSRAPMCQVSGQDWYLFEPVQTNTDDVVIPLFFYEDEKEMFAKCVTPEYHTNEACSQLRMTIPSGLSFQSQELQTLSVSNFDFDYTAISGANGSLLKLSPNITTWHSFPNPWRIKADGRVIRHVPISLYCDDTSGNRFKRWNKHMSFYFTLAGLPPRWTNQNYNCHYLTTSNHAGAMELAGPIVADLRMMLTSGFPAYDCVLGEEVLLISTVLCFLGDSPMHAEITSTPIPGSTLHPCRACALSSTSLKEKATLKYVASFFMLSTTGSWIKHPPRSWGQIKQLCHQVWDMAHQPQKKTVVDESHTKLGVKDILNRTLLDRRYEILALGGNATAADISFLNLLVQIAQEDLKSAFNPFFELEGFDGCQDTPVEVLHVFLLGVVKYMVRDFMRQLSPVVKAHVKARYQSFNIDGLNIPSIQAEYLTCHFGNFIGKYFRIVVQAAPFVLFEYMDEDELALWAALCKLAPLIFQTHIEEKEVFLVQLTSHIRCFLYLLMKSTAQWKFEGYNSIVRHASIHSNRHSPGRDISINFSDYRILRHIISGGYFYDYKHKVYVAAGEAVVSIFYDYSSVQKSMGINMKAMQDSQSEYPCVRKWKVPTTWKVVTPVDLQEFISGYQLTQVHEVNWTSKDVILTGSFVVY
ncbi:hypothetical protein PSHT_06667 [Puccinia striiformis]|uniref:Uncharacterized protein n=1 Tax=Puccinia striiformis TaxID=27350 RepID=A0A2S4W4W3_9BASI|nr:hypothetical protein PSHT_06667 [Puccinia striiformis]